ncbi:hypothetical protein GGF41_007137 [Coemansia sp. RSA 2531]|nr:hypothetical protein GGF41_007137 [Coemansia sp. RSA 2531]
MRRLTLRPSPNHIDTAMLTPKSSPAIPTFAHVNGSSGAEGSSDLPPIYVL